MGTIYSVLGPPGTGKTSYLIRQIERALEKHPPESIMVASFTRAAAANIAQRAKDRVPKHQVGTMHAICFRLMQYPTVAESGKMIKEWNNAHGAHLRLSGGRDGEDDDFGFEVEAGMPGDALMSEYQKLRAKMVPREVWPMRVRAFADAWDAWKQEVGAVDFTDMIETAYRDRLGPPPGVRIGFFDEVQDFTRLEGALLRSWASKLEYAVIAGDDDQTIYHFKGADPHALTDGVDRSNIRVLSQSWRIPASVHRVATAWVKQLGGRREEKEYAPREEEGRVRRLPGATWRQPEAILADIERNEQEDGGPVRSMVLASAGFHLDPLKAVLRKRGLPFHNPYRLNRGDWNPLRASTGTSIVDRIAAFLKPYDQYRKDADLWTPRLLWSWVEVINGKGVLQTGAKQKIEAAARGPRADAVLDIDALLNVFTEDGLSGALAGGLPWLREHLLAARRKSAEYPIRVIEAHGLRAATREPPLIIGTVHSVKGGEADRVYLFPDLSPAAMREWASPGEGRDAIIRTVYVGMTRAKKELVLCGPAGPAITWPRGA